ncbi:hypothetical protein CONPUDRAFT_75285 [Coniophora puteana RWD-64-598 SS2]|uniref:Uncharacterized protein n=1 Tax=Coniophora puteana (strain RWD-64-598) TaxID=741705 RepID=A0A5M3MI31_CONPW|nr:uncharacterized protein CONPUDRAFT_75285 [Coniophora puteana RWD-64-598 SS2]EIW78666.1 hypothetical protein CONPUDRAFT_75285 [Coniophora puteana RWD-64-598 SS2]
MIDGSSLFLRQACISVALSTLIIYDYALRIDRELYMPMLRSNSFGSKIVSDVSVLLPDKLHPHRCTEGIVIGIPECWIHPPTAPLTWVNPVNNGVSLAFDAILLAMVMFRYFWQLREKQKQSPAIGLGGIMDLLVQHHLVYFGL